jgi:hypothetical protein
MGGAGNLPAPVRYQPTGTEGRHVKTLILLE